MAYDQVDPFGDSRADLRAGIITSTVANVNRDPDKRREPFTPQDFMPVFDQDESKPQGMSPEDMLALVRFYMPPTEEIPQSSDYDEDDDGDFDTNEV